MLFFVKFSLYQDHGYDYIPQRIIDWLEAGPTFLQDSGRLVSFTHYVFVAKRIWIFLVLLELQGLMPWFRRFGHSSQFTYASDCASGGSGSTKSACCGLMALIRIEAVAQIVPFKRWTCSSQLPGLEILWNSCHVTKS